MDEEVSISALLERGDRDALDDLASRLDGRPVPRLRMTEKQFDAWADEDVRAEWVDGEVIVMSPVSGIHSDLFGFLFRIVTEFVEHRELGLVRGSEFQVRLANRRARRTPDLLFVARSRLRIVKRTYVDGPPDLIMEVVSPESESRDWRDKFLDYEAAGVREYWIVDPQSQRVEAYHAPRRGKYRRLDETDGRIHSKVLRGLFIRPAWLWRSPLPRLDTAARELKLRR
jgi:Uma2 family endonuclease